jgi:hypothetical protein
VFLEYDVLADRRSLRPLAYRFGNGTIEWIGTSSESATQMISYEEIPARLTRRIGSGKPSDMVIHREHLEPKPEIVYNDDGTEHVVTRRQGVLMAKAPEPEAPADEVDEIAEVVPPRKRRFALRAGKDAETEFTLVHRGGEDESRPSP